MLTVLIGSRSFQSVPIPSNRLRPSPISTGT